MVSRPTTPGPAPGGGAPPSGQTGVPSAGAKGGGWWQATTSRCARWGAGAAASLERLLLPNACLSCERLVESATPDALVCAVCRSRLQVAEAGCTRCAQPRPPIGPCRVCRPWPAALRTARSAVWLGREAREIVHRLKYEGFTRLAPVAAEAIRRRIRRPDGGVLVAVPLGAVRQRARGYNQAHLIARALATRWELPLAAGALRRIRETASQTALTPEARLANVAGAFAAVWPPGSVGAVLVDDVFTTGATLAAAARALEAAGCADIVAITFARALPLEIRALADR